MMIRLTTVVILLAMIKARYSARSNVAGAAGEDKLSRSIAAHKIYQWTPPGTDHREDWLARHGANRTVYHELLSLVKLCKVMMLRHEGYEVTMKDVSEMDVFLFGSLPSLEQAEECVELHKHRHKRKLLNFKNVKETMWSMPIIYKYDGGHTQDAILMIQAAIRHWEAETCIRFKRVGTKATVTKQHILITSESGCYSYVGQVPKKEAFPQQLNLEPYSCTDKLGFAVHEIGHAIGFWHEHVRADREEYVTVNMSYVIPSRRHNYEKLDAGLVKNKDVPYDVGSLMHYTATEMSIPEVFRLYAIKAKDPLSDMTLGQRVGLSFFDAKLANLAYCADKCSGVKPALRCYNRGYRDPNDCSKCKCPEGFGKRQCRDPAPANGGCKPTSSGIITVTSTKERCLNSRHYNQADGEGVYKHGDKCNWLLKAKAGRKIEVRFRGPKFSLYCYYNGPACYHWVEIKYKKDLSLRGPRFCGNRGVPDFNGKTRLRSESNKMMVVFNAEYPLFSNAYTIDVFPTYRKGFRLCYRLAPK